MFTNKADPGGGYPLGFQVVTGRADRAGTVGSDGDEADRIHIVLLEQSREQMILVAFDLPTSFHHC